MHSTSKPASSKTTPTKPAPTSRARALSTPPKPQSPVPPANPTASTTTSTAPNAFAHEDAATWYAVASPKCMSVMQSLIAHPSLQSREIILVPLTELNPKQSIGWTHVITDSYTFATVLMKSRPLVKTLQRVHLIDPHFGPLMDSLILIKERDARTQKLWSSVEDTEKQLSQLANTKSAKTAAAEQVTKVKKVIMSTLSRIVCDELRALSKNQPVAVIRCLFEALMSVVCGSRNSGVLDYQFSTLALCNLDEPTMMRNVRKVVKRDSFSKTFFWEKFLLEGNVLTRDRVEYANKTCAILYDWIDAQVGLAETLLSDEAVVTLVVAAEEQTAQVEKSLPEHDRYFTSMRDISKIQVTRTVLDAWNKAVAEYVVGHLISHGRSFDAMRKHQIGHQWQHDKFVSFKNLRDMRICVLGATGPVGKAVVSALTCLGCSTSNMLLCNRTSFPSTATEIADCDVVISLLPFSQSSRDTVQKLGSSWSKDGHPIPLLVNVGELSVYSVCPLEMFQTRVIDWCDAVEPIMPESSKWWSVPNTIVTPHVASGQAKVEELAKAWQTVTKTDVLTW